MHFRPHLLARMLLVSPPPSAWMPPKSRDAAIKQTMIDVERQLEMLEGKRCKDNLPSDEISPLRHLRQQNNVLIKPADKISAVVMFNKENYMEEVDRQ